MSHDENEKRRPAEDLNQEDELALADEELARAIHDSFAAMTPDDETLDRMLSRLTKAAESPSEASPAMPAARPAPRPVARRRIRYEVWGSLAACLVVVVGLCVVLFSSAGSNTPMLDGISDAVIHDLPASSTASSHSSSSASSSTSSKTDKKADQPASYASVPESLTTQRTDIPSSTATTVTPPTPVVSLDDGKALAIVQTDPEIYPEADTDLITEEVVQGTAIDDESGDEVSYIVFNYAGADDAYAVQFNNTGAIYLAVPVTPDPAADEEDPDASAIWQESEDEKPVVEPNAEELTELGDEAAPLGDEIAPLDDEALRDAEDATQAGFPTIIRARKGA